MLIGLTRDENGATKGVMQLYSVEKGITQPIEGHAAAFCDFKLSSDYTTTIICIAANTQQGGKLFVMEVPGNKPPNAPVLQKRMVPVQFPAQNDFPVAMQVSDKHGVIYMITKTGFLYLFEVETATLMSKCLVWSSPNWTWGIIFESITKRPPWPPVISCVVLNCHHR